MKLNYLTHSTLVIGCLLTACSKEKSLVTHPQEALSVNNNTSLASGALKPLTVITVAGKVSEGFFYDGQGTDARLNSPEGIDLLENGTFYIAENTGNGTRKVTPDYYVSTVNIPPSKNGEKPSGAIRVKVQKDGTINILTRVGAYPFSNIRVFIVKPNGDVITPAFKNDYRYTYLDLEKDPYDDRLWVSGIATDTVNNKSFGILERFTVRNGKIGTETFKTPIDSLTDDNKVSPQITGFFCGYNGVKYIVINGNAIYKLTPSGVFTQIYKSLRFGHETTITGSLTSIVATKDSRTIYIADVSTIRSISNGVTRTLVGPQPGRQYMDGTGNQADVHAKQLALSKDESALYFTDRNALRKLILR
ncbi:hypothetical protein IDJ77_04620 [Mucilaginibacter sp. ZT4R22]|uniref:ScyD/ScyE family protein n=1 Tax=Mucilaginibacter pankratovii TaxID=2772110 RepID=A0ABR7WL83_9SPHI|nr:hypothetical protein [Mucilaginibacter pankratovii]MBD1363087.1 hypothetical protein [Mucilaginibacter pankratovii]